MAEQTQTAGPLEGVVGWRMAGDSSGENLPESLSRSDSGLYVQGLNELMDLSIVAHIVPEGQELANWLESITKDTLTKLATAALAVQSVVPSKPLLQDVSLIPWPARAASTETKTGRFVAFELRGRKGRGLATTLTRIGVQLDTAQPSLPLYVYQSTEPAPIAQTTVAVPRGGYPAWQSLAEPLALDPEADYFIGYYEDDLTGSAVRRPWEPGPCFCANDTWGDYKHYQPRSVVFPAVALNEDRSRPALQYAQSVDASLGLNVEVLTICDPMKVLSLPVNRGKLAEAIQMALSIRVLTGIISTPNISQVTQRADIQQDAYSLLTKYEAQLYGGKDGNTDAYYTGLLKRLTLDTGSLDDACLPTKKPGITVGQISR